jgi:hypothetical protein
MTPERYLQQLDTADRQEPSDALAAKSTRLREKIAKLRDEMRRPDRRRATIVPRTRPFSEWRFYTTKCGPLSRRGVMLPGSRDAVMLPLVQPETGR